MYDRLLALAADRPWAKVIPTTDVTQTYARLLAVL
jgi:hypothetical protein